MGVGRGDVGKHRGIDHPQALNAVHPQRGIDHPASRLGRHAAGAAGVVDGATTGLKVSQQSGVIQRRRIDRRLTQHQALHGPGLLQAADQASPSEYAGNVLRIGQCIGVDAGRLRHIGRGYVNAAPAARAAGVEADNEAGVRVGPKQGPLAHILGGIAQGVEIKLRVRPLQAA